MIIAAIFVKLVKSVTMANQIFEVLGGKTAISGDTAIADTFLVVATETRTSHGHQRSDTKCLNV